MEYFSNTHDFEEFTWEVIDKFFHYNKGYQLVKHQIESFNDFVLNKLAQILDGFNPIEITHQYNPEYDKFVYTLMIDVTNPILGKPLITEKDGSTKIMTPNDARLRNFTYSAVLSCDVVLTTRTLITDGEKKGSFITDTKKIVGVILGKIPIMVKSNYCTIKHSFITQEEGNECKYDFGGYFVINGNEKVVISQDRISENRTYVFLNNKISTYSHVAEIRSVQENKLGVPKITSLKLSSKGNQFGRYIRANIHHIKNDIPLFILFKALGLASDKEILRYIVYDLDNPISKLVINELIGCIEEANMIHCQKDAIEYLARYLNITGYPREVLNNKIHRNNIVRSVLEKEFLPHVGKAFYKKALYLGFMVNKLIKCFLGLKEFDDRDSYINKKVDTPGILMANLFRQYYGKVVKDMKNTIQKEINSGGWKATNNFINVINRVNINKVIKSTIIDSGMRYALATGNWGIKSNKNKQGVAQVLNRLTYNSMISHLRRVNTPIEKSGKLIQPRKLHSTQWGIICPAETPEGASVGLVKNLAVAANITIASNSTHVHEIIRESDVIMFDGDNIDIFKDSDTTKVVINGDIVGVHLQPEALYEMMRQKKRMGVINPYTSVVWNIQDNELRICTEGGRCVRPLYVTYKGENGYGIRSIEPDMDWNDVMRCGCVEYIDVEEANSLMIAMSLKDLGRGVKGTTLPVQYTHLEIHPALILGAIASCIPFSDHNQAPRVAYQSSMAKQALGVYTSNFRQRFDTMGHVLDYPQKPLVRTKLSSYVNKDNLPCGINAIVAIATYTGFNQEDSIIMSKSAVDRGLFTSTYFRTYKEQNNKNHSNGEEEFFKKPDETARKNKPYNYDKLHDDGFVPENTFVKSGDVIIGKMMPSKTGTSIVHKDNSVPLKNNEKGYIDKNCYNDKYYTNVNGDGYNFCKVRVRSVRVPTVGDKFACYTPDHDVLTDIGWKAISLLTLEDRVATLVGGILIYQRPTAIQEYDFDGELYDVHGVSFSLRVTGNHRMYVRGVGEADYKISMAQDLDGEKSHYYKRVADVWVPPRGRDGEEAFDHWMWGMSRGDSRKLIDSLVLASDAGEGVITCDTPKFLEECQRLCLHAGYAASGVSSCGLRRQWHITVEKFDEERVDACHTAWIPYHGKVYCCTVPLGEGVVYVRRGRESAGVWCGQSRSAQKGTCGILYGQEDMPFTREGITPDIIMNPHAIPSRMTIGQLIECVMGKACVSLGTYGDATPFTELSVEHVAEILEEHGMERYGNEVLYNSRTGEQIDVDIFIGPTYYQRLKHMTVDKIHSRSQNGPIVLLTRQPAEGRARDGGLRLGEMEIECAWSHGTQQFLKERFMECSDNYRVFICKNCGLIATVNPDKSIYTCKVCKNTSNFAEIRIPYACKLLMQEIQTMGIGARFITGSK
jgi:DNA-directed RNA polymerase II subunit RPB2